MNQPLRKLQIALSLCLLLSLLVVGAGTAAAPVVIDHFTVAQTVNITYPAGGTTHLTDVSSVAGLDILGGERDLISEVWSADSNPPSDQPYQASVGGHSLVLSAGNQLHFTAELQWDGTADVSKGTIDPIGLQTLGTGVDLTAGGNDRFIFGIPSSDLGGQFIVRIYTSATECSQSTFNFPGGISNFNQTVVERLFSTFSSVSATNIICPTYSALANITNVGAISLTIATSNSFPSLDMSLDLVAQAAGPYKDFGDLPDDGGTAFRYEYFKDVAANKSEAFHVDTGLTLGLTSSLENTKRTDATNNATADTLDNGVTASGLPWSAGTNTGQVTVVVAGCPAASCYLTAFIDWNQDGSFWDVPLDNWQTGERILNNVVVTNGSQAVKFNIPSIVGITDGSFANKVFYLRFRVTADPFSQGTAYGAAFSGEVEDYKLTFGITPVTFESLRVSNAAAPLQSGLPFAAVLAFAALAVLFGWLLRRK